MTKRCEYNPLITPKCVKPSREDFVVEGVFNCGVTKLKDEYLLLCRVAESVKTKDPNFIIIPIVKNHNGEDRIETIEINKQENPQYDYTDSRSIWTKDANGSRKIVYLTSLSHLRLARSYDGINFTLSDSPTIIPNAEEEAWGMEDPRITAIENDYYITYTAVTSHGAASALIRTKDFHTFERLGIIFAPENKDVTIFPEKINGVYLAINRPVPTTIGTPDMWMSESPDLLHWGKQKHFLGVSKESSWINGRIGGGAVPIKTEKGWVVIYHAADKENRYCLGALLLDANNPMKILANSSRPILQPEEIYETEGFFENVVFTCGALLENDIMIIYYGAADDKICRVDLSMEDIYQNLTLSGTSPSSNAESIKRG